MTARSFAYAIDRTANKQLASPGAAFITDPNGTNIVGAKKVSNGHARHVSGVTAKGYRLVIRLTRPDGSFLSKLTFPFFQATSTKLPLNREVSSAYPSAGPYAITKHVPDSETELRRNRYYRGPRPRHLAGVDVRWNLNEQSGFQQVLNNQLDEGPLPLSEIADVATRFGVNKTRFSRRRDDHPGPGPSRSPRPDQTRLQAGKHQHEAVLLRARAVPGHQLGPDRGRRLVH